MAIRREIDPIGGKRNSGRRDNAGDMLATSASTADLRFSSAVTGGDEMIVDVIDIVRAGDERMKRNDYDGAREFYAEAHGLDPASFAALEGLCRVAYEQREWDTLRPLCDEALELSPNNDLIILFQARAETAARNWLESARLWQVVLQHRPGWTEAMFQVARSCLRAGERGRAVAATEALAAHGATDVATLRLLGRVASEAALARIAFDAYAGLARADQAAAITELNEQERGGDLRTALLCAAALIVVSPDLVEPERFEALATRLRQRGERAEAAGDLTAACDDYRVVECVVVDSEIAARALNRIYRLLMAPARVSLKDDEIDQAREQYAAVLDNFPDDAEALHSYGRVLMRLRDYAAAEPIWKRLVVQKPELAECDVQLGRVYERTRRFLEASQAWSRVLANDPTHEEALVSAANIERNLLGDLRGAMVEQRWFDAWGLIRATREFAPSNEELRVSSERVGRAVLRAMRAAFKDAAYSEILQLGEMASDLIAEDAEMWLLIGRAGMEQRDYDVALPAWEALLVLDPESRANPLLQIARCHDRTGKREEARIAAARVLAAEPGHEEAMQIQSRA